MYRIILKQMGEGSSIGQVVNSDDIELIVLQCDAQYVPANSTKAVDSNFYRQLGILQSYGKAVTNGVFFTYGLKIIIRDNIG